MLVVLLVLLMSTATATFAVHSTTMEIRSAGHYRESVQARGVAEGAVLATLEYMDALGPAVMYQQLIRNQVQATESLAPEEITVGRTQNVFRLSDASFVGGVDVAEAPIETDPADVPSLGPGVFLQPRFTSDLTDTHACFRMDAGRRADGRSSMQYLCGVVTARARLAPPTDFTATDDLRSYHEVASNARALVEVGPMPAL
jgi:hypothetical protein